MREIAIIREAWREPIEVLAAFADEPWALGLLSGGDGAQAHWSYLARKPDRTLVVAADDPTDPLEALTSLLGPPLPARADGPPFQGGVAGLCGYELGARIEAMPLARLDDWPDLAVARYPAILAFDHAQRRVLAIGRGEDEAAAQAKAREALSWLTEAELQPPVRQGGRETNGRALGYGLICDPAAQYESAVAEVIDRIGRGEIFQANLARAWHGRLVAGARPFDLLARLVGASPAPFAAYLRLADRAIVSNSPERFVSVARHGEALRAETRPIKGTALRGQTPAQDACNAAALTASAKDRAENLMIVDLMRNDLSRVCSPGSVETPELFRLESFANVHHLVSTVVGRLSPGRTAVDLLRASLPPGSITGAPKLQAMKVIAGHEAPRGPFFGAMVWAGFDGALDSSVLIRTVAFKAGDEGWRLEARAGAGIVADSDPLAEARETEAKIGAIVRALGRPGR